MRLVPVAGVCWIYKKASMSRSSKPAGGHSLDSQTEQLQQIIDRTFALSHTLQRVLIEVRRVAAWNKRLSYDARKAPFLIVPAIPGLVTQRAQQHRFDARVRQEQSDPEAVRARPNLLSPIRVRVQQRGDGIVSRMVSTPFSDVDNMPGTLAVSTNDFHLETAATRSTKRFHMRQEGHIRFSFPNEEQGFEGAVLLAGSPGVGAA